MGCEGVSGRTGTRTRMPTGPAPAPSRAPLHPRQASSPTASLPMARSCSHAKEAGVCYHILSLWLVGPAACSEGQHRIAPSQPGEDSDHRCRASAFVCGKHGDPCGGQAQAPYCRGHGQLPGPTGSLSLVPLSSARTDNPPCPY